MTDATLAALDALKLPLEHDIEELKRSDDAIMWTIGFDLENEWKRLQSTIERYHYYAHKRTD